jgi:hypothetical protein
MIIVPLEPGTPEWLDYRKAHGMAQSDEQDKPAGENSIP